MKNSTIYGIAAILGTIGFTTTMIFHPTGAEILPGNPNALHGIQVAVYTHGLALGCLPVAFFGFFGLSQMLGARRPFVLAALIAYGFSAVAGMSAAVLSGFGATGVAKQMLKTDDAAAAQMLKTLYQYTGFLNQGFARMLVVALAAAVVLWSVELFRTNGFGRIAGVAGWLTGAFALGGFFSGLVGLEVFGFGLIIFAYSSWTILAAVWMIKSGEPPPEKA